MRWSELQPDAAIIEALEHARHRPDAGDQNQKRRWSEEFANGCAVAIAKEVRKSKELRNKRILPLEIGSGTEPLTPLGAGTSKRIDVTVADPVLGLEVGVSLKGLNFRDSKSGNYDKNLTGRLYELSDEVRLVHEHLPHAFMAGLFFLPIASTDDKVQGQSSFAHTVIKLRERTGRLDAALMGHAPRCDAGYVALYTTGAEPERYPPGLVRFLNVENNPPRRGRPRVAETLTLAECVEDIVNKATFTKKVDWSDPESD
jgi:hypothetical protein